MSTPTPAQLDAWLREFHRKGWVHLPGVLAPGRAAGLRDSVAEAHAQPDPTGSEERFHRVQMFLRGAQFEELIDQEPVAGFAEALLGEDCHMIAMNTVYTGPDSGIDAWHVDETVHVPLPAGVTLDPRIDMPVFVLTAMYYLVDVPVELGPTEIVPGSHRSGRRPPQGDKAWEGQGPVKVTVAAGDCILLNGQTWHRGSRNVSRDDWRVVQQVTYGRRFIAQRFYPFVNHRMPEDLLARSNPRRRRLLGIHPRGPYG